MTEAIKPAPKVTIKRMSIPEDAMAASSVVPSFESIQASNNCMATAEYCVTMMGNALTNISQSTRRSAAVDRLERIIEETRSYGWE